MKERIWTKNFISLMSSCALYNMATQMIMPIIPLFIVAMGATETQVGLLATAFFVSSIITRLLVNILIKWIRRLHLAYLGMLLAVIVIALFCIAETVGVTAILRIAQGVGFGIITTLLTAMGADALPDSRRGEGIGYFGMGVVLAMTIAPIISISLMESFGFNQVFLVSAGVPLVAAVILSLYKPPPHVKEPTQEIRKKEPILQQLFEPKASFQAALVILTGLCRSADMNFIAIFAELRKLEYLALYFSVQTVASFLTRLFAGRISDRKGRSWVLIPGGIAVLVAMVMLSVAQSGEVMLLAGFFNGIGIGVLVPGMQVWLFEIVAAEKRNVASSMYFNFYDIGVSVGAILLGVIAENLGYSWMWQTTAFSAFLFLVLYIFFGRKHAGIKHRY